MSNSLKMSENGGAFSRRDKLQEASKTLREEKLREQRHFNRDLMAAAAAERRDKWLEDISKNTEFAQSKFKALRHL